ncbi:hypothetical protein [Actinomadura parmotrematis]|uniref:Uncharacterized protein n=1 Tax=Actinomadura parmotrematis TaxID=2864039 RepID=A0ABS7FUR5_9ACTN|nr:hypothetical protein [Actinomadura parmotrematis]MBW8484154.1 hypothetical protein [Actinomadura parmotrematis]
MSMWTTYECTLSPEGFTGAYDAGRVQTIRPLHGAVDLQVRKLQVREPKVRKTMRPRRSQPLAILVEARTPRRSDWWEALGAVILLATVGWVLYNELRLLRLIAWFVRPAADRRSRTPRSRRKP